MHFFRGNIFPVLIYLKLRHGVLVKGFQEVVDIAFIINENLNVTTNFEHIFMAKIHAWYEFPKSLEVTDSYEHCAKPTLVKYR